MTGQTLHRNGLSMFAIVRPDFSKNKKRVMEDVPLMGKHVKHMFAHQALLDALMGIPWKHVQQMDPHGVRDPVPMGVQTAHVKQRQLPRRNQHVQRMESVQWQEQRVASDSI